MGGEIYAGLSGLLDAPNAGRNERHESQVAERAERGVGQHPCFLLTTKPDGLLDVCPELAEAGSRVSDAQVAQSKVLHRVVLAAVYSVADLSASLPGVA